MKESWMTKVLVGTLITLILLVGAVLFWFYRHPAMDVGEKISTAVITRIECREDDQIRSSRLMYGNLGIRSLFLDLEVTESKAVFHEDEWLYRVTYNASESDEEAENQVVCLVLKDLVVIDGTAYEFESSEALARFVEVADSFFQSACDVYGEE